MEEPNPSSAARFDAFFNDFSLIYLFQVALYRTGAQLFIMWLIGVIYDHN